MVTFRAFVAVVLEQEVHTYLDETGKHLSAMMPPRSVRWVRPASIHLTLSFLGDVNVGRVPDLVDAMDRVAALSTPFEVKLNRLGCFPNPKRPRVIWIGISDNGNQLQKLQRMVQDELVNLGWKPDNRPFNPHLTLGRVKDKRSVVKADLPWGQPAKPMAVQVDAFHLIESQLRPDGAVYSIRHSSLLQLGNASHAQND